MVPNDDIWPPMPTMPANKHLDLSHNADPKDKPKKPRHRHSAFQLAALNELYEKNEHPPLDERTALAERLGMYAPFSSLSLMIHSAERLPP